MRMWRDERATGRHEQVARNTTVCSAGLSSLKSGIESREFPVTAFIVHLSQRHLRKVSEGILSCGGE
jgi:hypothetical protein